MVRFVSLLAVATYLATAAQAFAPVPARAASHRRPAADAARSRRASSCAAAPPSPADVSPGEGGEDLAKMSSSLPGSCMKNMGADEEDGVFRFWLSATAAGEKVKKLRTQCEREASRKANFPGFRKGQVPPYAQGQITTFAVQEAIIKTCEESLEAYGLESLPGSAGEVTVIEDIKVLCKGYKVGTDVAFTATYRGKFDSAVQAAAAPPTEDSSSEEVVVDVEAVAE